MICKSQGVLQKGLTLTNSE